MSNSSEGEQNGHFSDSEEVFAKSSKTRRKKYLPNFRIIRDLGTEFQTKEFQSIDSLSEGSDAIVKDGVMKAPPTVQVTPESESIPEYRKPSIAESEDTKEIDEYSPSPIEQIYNTRALSKLSSTYELEKFEKNAMIIFNQENVDGYKKRLGTERDVEALERTFKRFGFEVEERKDRTRAQLFTELEEFASSDFTDYGCVAVAVLTHGSRQGLLRARDLPYCEIDLVIKFLHKPLLVTKPIIFIIQACRGTKQTVGVAVHSAGRVQRDVDEEVEAYTLPVEADMLILHSSYIGKPSHRNELHGSWFIQSLCSKIDDLAESHDLETILTEVKREVAIDRHHKEYNRRTLEMDINKQMPVTTSTLIRKLYLKKYGEDGYITTEAETKGVKLPAEDIRLSSEARPDRSEAGSPIFPSEVYCDRRMRNTRQSSRDEVLDSGGPRTPGVVQYGSCECFLSHFNYIKDCLRHFVEEYPEDATAQGFLNIADTFKDDREFNATKEMMLRTMSSHLINNAQACTFYKYLHFYKN